jgi:hypothetical protein
MWYDMLQRRQAALQCSGLGGETRLCGKTVQVLAYEVSQDVVRAWELQIGRTPVTSSILQGCNISGINP